MRRELLWVADAISAPFIPYTGVPQSSSGAPQAEPHRACFNCALLAIDVGGETVVRNCRRSHSSASGTQINM